MNTLPSSLRIGVLRGGPSLQYETSLQTGQDVLKHLSVTHEPLDIFISRDGLWHMRGVEKSPERILQHVDVVWNALHGAYGEDGTVQGILDEHGTKYTGSNKLSSALSMNKHLTKERARGMGIKTPLSVVIRKEEPLEERMREIFGMLPYPLIVKPTHGVFSDHVYTVSTPAELMVAIEAVLSQYPSVLVEEKIVGKPVSCATLDMFRGEEIYAFPPQGAPLSSEEVSGIEKIAKDIHSGLDLSHYALSDFIVSPKRGVYFLEVNTLPDISEKSLFRKSLESVGSSMKEFLHHTIGLALK